MCRFLSKKISLRNSSQNLCKSRDQNFLVLSNFAHLIHLHSVKNVFSLNVNELQYAEFYRDVEVFFVIYLKYPFWTKYFQKINIVLLKYIFGANSKWHNFLLFTKFLWKVILTKVKSNLKSSITSFVYELPHELLQDLEIVILRNKEKKREISRMVEVTG